MTGYNTWGTSWGISWGNSWGISAPLSSPVISTGSGPEKTKNEAWKKYLKWLEKRKKKQIKRLLQKEAVSLPIAIKIVDDAANAATEKQKTEYHLLFDSRKFAARKAAEQTIISIYEQIWQEMITKELKRRKDIDDEETFFMLM